MCQFIVKSDIITELSRFEALGKGRIIVKVLDYSDNSLSPEKVAYRVYYTNYSGERRKVTYWPNTVGFQWS